MRITSRLPSLTALTPRVGAPLVALSALLAGLSGIACGSAPPAPPPATPTTSATPPPPPAAPAMQSAPPAEPTAPKSPPPTVTPAIRAAVDAADRSDMDKKVDGGRHPAETLAFFGIAPGMRVADIGAATGYTTELLARVVGPTGVVYGQNSKALLSMFAEKPWSLRLAKPVNKNVKRVDRDFDDPLPPDAKDLDAVIDVLFYHDTFWLKVDRDRMNKAIFASLKKGGVYGIVDHSGRAGSGSTEVETLHRIEQKVVKDEIEKAGFKLAAEGDFLRNAEDTRDWNASPTAAAARRGTSDRFVLKFVKP